jgi:hypothetical protein
VSILAQDALSFVPSCFGKGDQKARKKRTAKAVNSKNDDEQPCLRSNRFSPISARLAKVCEGVFIIYV